MLRQNVVVQACQGVFKPVPHEPGANQGRPLTTAKILSVTVSSRNLELLPTTLRLLSRVDTVPDGPLVTIATLSGQDVLAGGEQAEHRESEERDPHVGHSNPDSPRRPSSMSRIQ